MHRFHSTAIHFPAFDCIMFDCTMTYYASYQPNQKPSEFVKASSVVWTCVKYVGESHHCYNWSRAHVAHQCPEERLTPQFPVVFPQKTLRRLMTHKTDKYIIISFTYYISP